MLFVNNMFRSVRNCHRSFLERTNLPAYLPMSRLRVLPLDTDETLSKKRESFVGNVLHPSRQHKYGTFVSNQQSRHSIDFLSSFGCRRPLQIPHMRLRSSDLSSLPSQPGCRFHMPIAAFA